MDMNHDELLSLIDELIEECINREITGTIAVYGGSAVLFHHPELRATHDVDSMFRPYQAIRRAAEAVASRHDGLGVDWLNMRIRDVMPLRDDDEAITYYDRNGLIVRFASQRYLLAMKAMSDRRSQKDLDDAAVLFNALHLRNWMDVDDIVHRYFGAGSAGAQELFMEDIEERAQELTGQNLAGDAGSI